MKDVRTAGANVAGEKGFNEQLMKTIESHKALTDARGVSHYAPEPRHNAGGTHTPTHTTTPTKNGRE